MGVKQTGWHDIHRAKQRALRNKPNRSNNLWAWGVAITLLGIIIYINK